MLMSIKYNEISSLLFLQTVWKSSNKKESLRKIEIQVKKGKKAWYHNNIDEIYPREQLILIPYLELIYPLDEPF